MLPVKRAEWSGGSSKFHSSPRYPLSVLHTQRGEWWSTTVHSAKAHLTAALNWCHWDAGHQGCDHILSLLQECFWWPRMAKQMRQTLRACTHCLQYEGGFPKAHLCPIVATAPLDLLHIDFTSIETMLEPNQSPRVANVLVFQDHFMKHEHTHNATQSTVTGYSPHYLIFRWWPRVMVDFVFPTVGSNKVPTREASAKHVDEYIASIRIDSGLPCGRHKPNQWQKHINKNGTTTER